MNYLKLVIAIQEDYQESLIAEMLELDISGFEQRKEKLITYLPGSTMDGSVRERIEEALATYPGNNFIQSEEVMADRNWNEKWEETIRPQRIGRFFVKPTWSKENVPGGQTLIEIDPKMSFGTGYHESTRLLLRMLPEVIRGGERVLDAGTGTGILAIAAARLGAGSVLAFDIDEWSVVNSRENIRLNEVDDRVEIRRGSIGEVDANDHFELIIANIDRNAILEMLSAFQRHLLPAGTLLLSGLLEDHGSSVEEALEPPMEIREVKTENEWLAIRAVNGNKENDSVCLTL